VLRQAEEGDNDDDDGDGDDCDGDEEELELIQTHMTQKPLLCAVCAILSALVPL
jgi:hypothetical protein